jgi:hypothetical protein
MISKKASPTNKVIFCGGNDASKDLIDPSHRIASNIVDCFNEDGLFGVREQRNDFIGSQFSELKKCHIDPLPRRAIAALSIDFKGFLLKEADSASIINGNSSGTSRVTPVLQIEFLPQTMRDALRTPIFSASLPWSSSTAVLCAKLCSLESQLRAIHVLCGAAKDVFQGQPNVVVVKGRTKVTIPIYSSNTN